MIVYDMKQCSPEWDEVRGTMPTASNFSKIITSNGAISGQFDKYAKQIAGLIPRSNGFQSEDMKNGVKYEPMALEALSKRFKIKIDKMGFACNDDKTAGFSPDGVIYDDIMGLIAGAEVKSVKEHIFDKYAKKINTVPTQYFPQVMGSMAISGTSHWYFGAYDFKNDRLFTAEVGRDEDWIKRFWMIVKQFQKRVLELKGQF